MNEQVLRLRRVRVSGLFGGMGYAMAVTLALMLSWDLEDLVRATIEKGIAPGLKARPPLSSGQGSALGVFLLSMIFLARGLRRTRRRRRSRPPLGQESFEFLRQVRQLGGGGKIPDPMLHVLDVCSGEYVEEPFDVTQILGTMRDRLHDQQIFHLRQSDLHAAKVVPNTSGRDHLQETRRILERGMCAIAAAGTPQRPYISFRVMRRIRGSWRARASNAGANPAAE